MVIEPAFGTFGSVGRCQVLLENEISISIKHWSRTQFLEGHSSAQFSSNPNQTHLIQLIKVFRITRNFQAGVIWSWLELNSAELWPSRNWVWDLCHKACQRKQAWSALKCPGRWLCWLWTSENTEDQHQQMTWQPKSSLTVETSHWISSNMCLMQHVFCASPLFLQTLGPWIPN